MTKETTIVEYAQHESALTLYTKMFVEVDKIDLDKKSGKQKCEVNYSFLLGALV